MLWSKRFAFGIDVIDEQHKQLFDLVGVAQNLIKDAKDGVDCYDEISTVLNELEGYTVEHFNYEESLMKNKEYEHFFVHKKEHDDFITKVQSVLEVDYDESQLETLKEVSEFLLTWISEHILISDAQYLTVLR